MTAPFPDHLLDDDPELAAIEADAVRLTEAIRTTEQALADHYETLLPLMSDDDLLIAAGQMLIMVPIVFALVVAFLVVA